MAEALARGCRVLIGHCHESDSILPFGPWVDACRGGGISADEEILGGLHRARRAELTRLFPEASVAGLPPTSSDALPLFESVAQLIEQVAAREPLVLVLEDLHWADEMSLRLLAFVGRRIPAWTALLVTTARGEELAETSLARRAVEDLSHPPQTTPLVLSPLSRADTALLVRALARVGSEAPTVAHVEEQIWVMSEGNPFVAVEAMRAFDDDRLSEGALEKPGALALPARVRDLVARRLDQLSARGQQVAAVAAVIGRQCDFALLRSASGIEERDAAEAVEEVVRHHVLQAVGHELDFTHDRVRDVVMGRLLPLRRRLLHRAVAEALEAVGARTVDAGETLPRDRPREHIEQLAYHAVRGEMWPQAVAYSRDAGAKAASRSAHREAVAFFEQALTALRHLPDNRHAVELGIDLRLALRASLMPAGDFERMLAVLREAETLAETLDDHFRLGQISSFLSVLSRDKGAYGQAITTSQRALELARARGEVALQAMANFYLGVAYQAQGDYRRAIGCLGDTVTFFDGTRRDQRIVTTVQPAVSSRAEIAACHAELGLFDEGMALAEDGLRIAEAVAQPAGLMVACWGVGVVPLRQENLARALPVLERAMALCQDTDLPFYFPWMAAALGSAHILAGRVADALPLLVHAVERTRGMRAHQTLCRLVLGEARLLAGCPEEAHALTERTLAHACERGERGTQAYALRLLGEIAARRSPEAEQAGDYYCQALAIADELGMRPLVAHCHRGLGELYRRTDQPDEARRHIASARRMYRDMDMRFWLEKAEGDG